MLGSNAALPRGNAGRKCRYARVETALGVTFAPAGDHTRPGYRAVTRDISHGGACLAVPGCSEALAERFADFPLLDIAIDEAPSAFFLARVEWVRLPAGPGAPVVIGVEFRDLNAAEEIAIIDLIAHALTASRAPLPRDAFRQQQSLPALRR